MSKSEAEPFLGVLMLDTDFERFPGDVGNPHTWSFPVRFTTVSGAIPKKIVGISDESFLDPFVQAGRELVSAGAIGLSTSCGFLSVYQRKLAERVSVPVLASSLALLPLIEMTLPEGKKVGILTFSGESLSGIHLSAVGIGKAVPIQGLPRDGCFQRAVRDGVREVDSFEAREADVLWAARKLVEDHPDVGCILCECTNISPHSGAIAAALGLPVHDIVTALNWFWSGIQPKSFAYPAALHGSAG